MSSMKENVNEKIKEYKLQKQSTEKALEVLREKIVNISFVGGENDLKISPQKQNKCIGSYYWTFLSYEEYRYKDEINIFKYCPKFGKTNGCKKTDCPGHQNYEEYILAEKNYQTEEKKLWKYPLWVMILACFKKDKTK